MASRALHEDGRRLADDFANKFGNTQHALTGERRACDALRSDLRRLRKEYEQAQREIVRLRSLDRSVLAQNQAALDRVADLEGEGGHQAARLAALRQCKTSVSRELHRAAQDCAEINHSNLVTAADNKRLHTAADKLAEKLEGVNAERLKFRDAGERSRAETAASQDQLTDFETKLRGVRSSAFSSLAAGTGGQVMAGRKFALRDT